MGLTSVCTALYDYTPQDDTELELKEGELVYILGDSDDPNWYRAKKKAASDDEEEPTGLIPNNYVEEAQPIFQAKALFDYSKQTEEEISFDEGHTIAVYDSSDPDWLLVGCDGKFGFAPSNYIERVEEEVEEAPAPTLPSRPIAPPTVPEPEPEPEPEQPAVPNPAANLASIISRQGTHKPTKTVQFTPEVSEDEGPPPGLPQRPISQQPEPTRAVSPPSAIPSPPPLPPLPQAASKQAPVWREPSPDRGGVVASPPLNRAMRSPSTSDGFPQPGGYHLYNINEMVSVMGKQKKMPTTLGINLATGVILISPEKERDGPQHEWSADKLKHYSIEGKHVFMELVQPSKSIDFHAGAKDTATEIVSALGELSGMAKAEGLREVIAASHGQLQKKGHMAYDFMAQGDDEVTVAEGDAVIVIDNTTSEEWWKVRRVKNGKEGVVPSSYVEIDDTSSPAPTLPTNAGTASSKSIVEQNRREEERLAKQALKDAQRREAQAERNSEVGPGLKLPDRSSSRAVSSEKSSSSRSKRDSRSKSDGPTTKPNVLKVRTWTDRSGTFKVEAQFLALKDGKIHLHKLNGIKIAVPVAKMSTADMEYVESVTNQSLDDEKPLSDIKKRNAQKQANGNTSGARIEKKPDYDWFDFFLRAGVSPYQCERYSYNFNKDSIDEAILEDLTPDILRKLGLKEGDIIRVMKYLDTKYSRTNKTKLRNVSNGEEGNDEGGLFSGPGGTLKNNTRKGRPAPPVQTNDTVDANAFRQGDSQRPPVPDKDDPDSPQAPAPPAKDVKGGFDDNAWDVKPAQRSSKPTSPAIVQSPTTATRPAESTPKPPLTGAMKELSLLDEPLIPIVTHSGSAQQSTAPPTQATSNQQLPPQHTGASPALFNQVAASQPIGITQPPIQTTGLGMMTQPTGQFQSQTLPRQRPQAPMLQPQQGAIMPPPPIRPVSAPLSAQQQQSSFAPPPLQPQLTGMPSSNMGMNSGPTLNNLAQMRMQQQQMISPPLQQQITAFPGQQFGAQPLQMQQTGFGLQPQMTGMMQQNPYILGQQAGSPFADPRFGQQPLQPQMTGFGQQSLQPQITGFSQQPSPFQSLVPQQTGGINSVLQPPLQPQVTGMNGSMVRPAFGQPPIPAIPSAFQSSISPLPTLGNSVPIPPIPASQPILQPLQPQKTGPAPNISFGMQPEVKKLVAQPTGKRANLSQATPNNPFGF